MRLMSLFVWLLACFGAGAAPALAQGAPQKLALVIAVGDYDGRDWPKLKNPPADAGLLKSSLEAAGFRVGRPAVNLRRAQLIQRLEEFRREAAKLPPNSIALIYFSGHGIQVDGTNYIVPLGTSTLERVERLQGAEREAVLSNEYISLNFLLDVFGRERRAQRSMANIVILDACRVNPLDSRTRAAGRPKGLADVRELDDNTLIAFAAAPGYYAYDGTGQNSPYAEALAAELKQGNVPLPILFTRVRARTMALTGDQQRPQYRDSLSEIFCFDRCGDTQLASLPSLPRPAAKTSGGPIMVERSAKVPDCAYCPELVEVKLGNRSLAISRFPVSVAQWRKCVEEANCPAVGDAKDEEDLPAVGVSWAAAKGYADWLSERTGKTWRLMTEQEWAAVFAPFKAEPRRKLRRLPSLATAANAKGPAYVGRILEWTSDCRGSNCAERVAMGATFDDDFSDLISSYAFAEENSGDALGFRLVRE